MPPESRRVHTEPSTDSRVIAVSESAGLAVELKPSAIMASAPAAKVQPAALLFVRTLTGKTIRIHANLESDTVEHVQFQIQDCEGIPPDQQRLIFAGRQMFPEEPLSAFSGLANHSTMHLILRLRGGMHHESSGREGFDVSPPPPSPPPTFTQHSQPHEEEDSPSDSEDDLGCDLFD
jgi:hypothetical protein